MSKIKGNIISLLGLFGIITFAIIEVFITTGTWKP